MEMQCVCISVCVYIRIIVHTNIMTVCNIMCGTYNTYVHCACIMCAYIYVCTIQRYITQSTEFGN